MLLLVASALAACSASTALPVKLNLSAPPSDLTEACDKPTLIPAPKEGTKLTQLQVETTWSTDRKRLLKCGKRHKLVVDFYRQRDDALTSSAPKE